MKALAIIVVLALAVAVARAQYPKVVERKYCHGLARYFAAKQDQVPDVKNGKGDTPFVSNCVILSKEEDGDKVHRLFSFFTTLETNDDKKFDCTDVQVKATWTGDEQTANKVIQGKCDEVVKRWDDYS